MSSFLTPVEYQPDTIREALDTRVALPNIQVRSDLMASMTETGQRLPVNEPLLINGLQEADITNQAHLTVTNGIAVCAMDALPKITYSCDVTRDHSIIYINPNPDPDYFLPRKLNTAFWAGILVTNAFGTNGEDSMYREGYERSVLRSKRIDKVTPFALMAIMAQTQLLGVGEVLIVIPEFIATAVAANKLHDIKGTHLVDFIAKKTMNQAVDLAIKYPVISYELDSDHSYSDIDLKLTARQKYNEAMRRIHHPNRTEALIDLLAFTLLGSRWGRGFRELVAKQELDAVESAVDFRPKAKKLENV